MTGKTHTFASLATSLLVADAIPTMMGKLAFVVGAGVTATLADIDLKLGIRHRGHTHSLTGVLVFSLCIIPLGINPLSTGLIWGYMMHILADSFTVYGTYPFYPNKRYRLRLGKFKTGNKEHELVFCGLVAGIVALYYYLKSKGV